MITIDEGELTKTIIQYYSDTLKIKMNLLIEQ